MRRTIPRKAKPPGDRSLFDRESAGSVSELLGKGGIDLLKYIQASTVGTGMNQEKIGYTNLHSYASEADWKAGKEDGNGIGIFSSKGVKRAVFRE